MIPTTVLPGDGALEAELLRHVLDAVSHDLGGLSSALALRADVMERALPSVSATACSRIAAELRVLGGQLRAISAPQGAETLSPIRTGSLEHWFATVSRFGQPLLRRGVALRGTVEDASIGSLAAHELTYVMLAILHAIRDRAPILLTEIRVSSTHAERTVSIWIALRDGAQQSLPLTDAVQSRWWAWAVDRATRARIDMRVDGDRVALCVGLENSAVA